MHSRNPFVNQVFGVKIAATATMKGENEVSQSLRKSGLWRHYDYHGINRHRMPGRNPFVNQVFGVTEDGLVNIDVPHFVAIPS